MSTPGVEHTIRTALDLIRQGRLQEAEVLSRRLTHANSGVNATLLACEIEAARGDFGKALEIVTAALARDGEYGALQLKRAEVLMALRRRSEAFAAADRAVSVGEPDPALLHTVAAMYMNTNNPARAKPLLYRALELAPGEPSLLYTAALSHFFLNETAEADALLARMLQVVPDNGNAWHVRSQLATHTPAANHIAELRSVLARPHLHEQDRMLVSFALAKELEDVGEFAQSFDALLQANRIKRATLTYDAASDARDMQNVAAHYSKPAMQALRGGDETAGPIFIVGMPRTGTTLVERILGSHSQVASVGEAVDFPEEMASLARATHARLGLTDPDLLRASLQMDFGELGRRYLAAVRQLSGGHRYTIDKLPFNFRYTGLIHKALPKAAIVHLTRDPMDTCYAVFKTTFINAYHFSYKLEEVAEYFVAYRRMMDHWHAVMPGVILDVRYEDLVADPEAQCRRLLAHCGLPWEEEVLDFHNSKKASTTASTAQVRRPIYKSSVQKWRNFARELQPVLKRLREAGLVDPEGNPPH